MEEAGRGNAFGPRPPQNGCQIRSWRKQNPYNGQNCVVVVVQFLSQQGDNNSSYMDSGRERSLERDRKMLQYFQNTARWEIEAHRFVLGSRRLVRNWAIY